MKFLNEEHKANYDKCICKGRIHYTDTERTSFFYIISGNKGLFDKVLKIYDFEKGSLKGTKFPLCSSEERLLKLAKHLFNGSCKSLSINDLFGYLDKNNFELAQQAIRIRFNK